MNDIAEQLRLAAVAYPEDVFGAVTPLDREQHPDIVQRASAQMGRHFAPLFAAAADEIESLRKRLPE